MQSHYYPITHSEVKQVTFHATSGQQQHGTTQNANDAMQANSSPQRASQPQKIAPCLHWAIIPAHTSKYEAMSATAIDVFMLSGHIQQLLDQTSSPAHPSTQVVPSFVFAPS